jgi:hypothetical protein
MAMSNRESTRPRRILWQNATTVISAAVLIGTEVFGAAIGGGWALGHFFSLGDTGTLILQGLFMAGGLYVMAIFIRKAAQAEPLTAR